MHDCPKIQEKLFDLVLHELAASEQTELLADIATCSECQTELESLEKTLSFYDRAVILNEPTKAEWQNYESSLRKRFLPPVVISQSFWRQIFFGSVRIPTPIFATVTLLLCVAAFFIFRSAQQNTLATIAPTVQTPAQNSSSASATVAPTPETIVIREERIVTRKIYVAKRQNPRQQSKQPTKDLPEIKENPLNLAEFKPVRSIEPNIIKGNEPK